MRACGETESQPREEEAQACSVEQSSVGGVETSGGNASASVSSLFWGSAGEIRAASGSEGVGAISVQFCLVARRPNFDFFFFKNNILAYEIKHFGIDGCPDD